MNLLLGVFQTRDVFQLPRQRGGNREKTALMETANGDVLEPDPTRSGPSQAPGFPSATKKVQGDERPLGASSEGDR